MMWLRVGGEGSVCAMEALNYTPVRSAHRLSARGLVSVRMHSKGITSLWKPLPAITWTSGKIPRMCFRCTVGLCVTWAAVGDLTCYSGVRHTEAYARSQNISHPILAVFPHGGESCIWASCDEASALVRSQHV
jgi:hypothetical protein